MLVGAGEFTYEFQEGWGPLPDDIALGWVAAIGVDSQDRIYIYSRGETPMVVFDREGNFLSSWGQGLLEDAHGIFIDVRISQHFGMPGEFLAAMTQEIVVGEQ